MNRFFKLTFMLTVLICCLTLISSAAVTLYAPDGRSVNVYEHEVDSYLNVGWYSVPVTVLYSADGRSAVVAVSEADAYRAVGWNDKTVLYAPDGRTISVVPWEVDAYVAYGWSKEPFVTMYSADGRTINVLQSQVYAYSQVGWYDDYNKVVRTLYSEGGKAIIVYIVQVPSYIKEGWSETVIVPGSESVTVIDARIKDGMVYRTPQGKKYHISPKCGGQNSYSVAFSAASEKGLAPCSRCAM